MYAKRKIEGKIERKIERKIETKIEQFKNHLLELVSRERLLLIEIIEAIREVDRRKLYVDFGHASLFDFLTKDLNYSAGAAQRRIDAARLLRDIPALAEDIRTGRLTLNQIHLVQRASRLSAKQALAIQVTAEKKNEALKLISKESPSRAEAIVAQFFDLPTLQSTRLSHQSDRSVRFEMTLSKEQFERLKQAQELLSHAVPSGDWVDLIDYMSKKVIQSRSGLRKKNSGNKATSKADPGVRVSSESASEVGEAGGPSGEPTSFMEASGAVSCEPSSNMVVSGAVSCESTSTMEAAGAVSSEPTSTMEVSGANSNESTSTMEVKWKPQDNSGSAVEANGGGCQHRDERSHKLCGSRWQLQKDHIKPKWAGGSNEATNFQMLCGVHNRRRYEKQAGIRRL